MSSSQSSLSSHRSAHVATDTSSNPAVYSFEKNVRNPEQLQYTLGKTIGSGTYAKVKAAWSPYEKKLIAIKIIQKRGASREVLTKFLPREMEALQLINHRNILRVYRLVETPRQVYFMMEMAQNGDLLDYINACRVLPEPEARYVMRSIAAGVAHCHSRDIVHRDIKCENIMITKDMKIKIGDFGFSRQVGAGQPAVSTPCGSFSYAAPELLAGKSVYDGKKVDIWSMGCILYAMVCGSLPFGDDTQVVQMINNPLEFPRQLTNECEHLLSTGMLNCDAEKRSDIVKLRLSHWMRGVVRPLTPYRHTKYPLEDCLPKLPRPNTSIADRSRPSVYAQPRPVCSLPQAFAPTPQNSPMSDSTNTTSEHTASTATKKSKKEGKQSTVKHNEQNFCHAHHTRTFSIKGRISSAGKKLTRFLGLSSSPHVIESDV